ncbi:hypothetical protein D3C78_306950 [compost metagenome]
MVVDRGVLLDIGVGGRYVGFRLVIVVVGNEVFDGVIRKEGAELAVKLCRQRLVGRQNQRRALNLGDDVGDAEGLPRPGHTQQRLVRKAGFQPFHHLANGLRLVAGGLEAGDKLKLRHADLDFGCDTCAERASYLVESVRAMSPQAAWVAIIPTRLRNP